MHHAEYEQCFLPNTYEKLETRVGTDICRSKRYVSVSFQLLISAQEWC